VATLQWSDRSSKESYKLSVRFIISELIQNGNSTVSIEEEEEEGEIPPL
jgi:hypothetical protein